MSDPVPLAMQWRFKELKKLLKETVPMTPNNGQAAVRPGQRIIVDLPFNSTVDLSTFAWYYKGSTTHLGASVAGTALAAVLAVGTTPAAPVIDLCGSRFFPRNSSSVIQSMQIKINGGIKVDIPDYNFVYNMLHDYTQGADALKRRSVGGENADPSNKQYVVGNDIGQTYLFYRNFGILGSLPKFSEIWEQLPRFPKFRKIFNHWHCFRTHSEYNVRYGFSFYRGCS
jgi:hypothetical protein